MRPYERTSERWPFWYKIIKPIEAFDPAQPVNWDPSLFDGDATIWNDCRQS